MLVPSSPGDALDRLTILALKIDRLSNTESVAIARRHRAALREAWDHHDLPAPDSLPAHQELLSVNGQLWEVEDALRAHEAQETFQADFVQLARSVYRLNDRRAALKASVDRALGAAHPEVKGYGDAVAT